MVHWCLFDLYCTTLTGRHPLLTKGMPLSPASWACWPPAPSAVQSTAHQKACFKAECAQWGRRRCRPTELNQLCSQELISKHLKMPDLANKIDLFIWHPLKRNEILKMHFPTIFNSKFLRMWNCEWALKIIQWFPSFQLLSAFLFAILPQRTQNKYTDAHTKFLLSKMVSILQGRN